MKTLTYCCVLTTTIFLYSCASTSTNNAEPFQVIPAPASTAEQTKEFNRANALYKADEKTLANDIWYKLANEGHIPSLELFAGKRSDTNGKIQYYEAHENKGCKQTDLRMEAVGGTQAVAYKTNFAIKILAEQGDLQAANIHFECEVGKHRDLRGIPQTNAVSVIQHAAEKGDLRALSNLVDFELSYYSRPRIFRNNLTSDLNRLYRFRPVEIDNAAKWARKAYETASIAPDSIDKKTINSVIESQVKVGGTYQYKFDDFTNAAAFYGHATKLCYSANAYWPERSRPGDSVGSICELAKNRYEALSEL